MANAKREEPPPQPPVKIVLEMSEDEAEIVCACLGGIGAQDSKTYQKIESIYSALDDALLNRTRAWSDFFASEWPYLNKDLP